MKKSAGLDDGLNEGMKKVTWTYQQYSNPGTEISMVSQIKVKFGGEQRIQFWAG